jgi:hypothetical protein
MTNRVPLHNHGGLKLRSKITGNPTLICKSCGDLPGKSNEFKNSVGLFIVSVASQTVSIDLYDFHL